MRTREEQIEEMVQVNSAYLCHEDYTPDNLRMMLAAAISEAEERARAECAADTQRYPIRYSRAIGQNADEMKRNLLKGSLYLMGDAVLIWANEGDLYMPGSAVLIDTAMEGGK